MRIVVLLVFLLPFVALIAVSLPRRSGLRLKFRKKEAITIPGLCVVTGGQANEWHVVQSFSGNPYYIVKKEVTLPFSTDGWTSYQKAYPLSLKTFKGGLASLTKAGVFGGFFAIFIWVPWAGFICGLIAAVELLLHRRQLVILNGVHIRKAQLCGIDILGAHPAFAQEFLRLNSSLSLDQYRADYAKKAKMRNTALIVGGCAIVLFLLIVFFVPVHGMPRKNLFAVGILDWREAG